MGSILGSTKGGTIDVSASTVMSDIVVVRAEDYGEIRAGNFALLI